MGVIALELAEVAPRLAQKSDQGHYLVNYDGIVPILIEAVKEQQDQIKVLKDQQVATELELKEIKALLKEMSK